MLEASRTQRAGVRFSGFFEITFLHRKWHEARMEQKQKCKIQYGLKTCTAEHSVAEGTQHGRSMGFQIPLTTCILPIASNRLFETPSFRSPVKTVSSRVAIRLSSSTALASCVL